MNRRSDPAQGPGAGTSVRPGDPHQPRTVSSSRPDGPRERLLQLGPRALSDAELLALTLRTGARGLPVDVVARRVVARFGGIAGLAREEVQTLNGVAGLGPAKSASLMAACEIGRRLATRRLEVGARIHGPEDVHRHFFARLRDYEAERFHALLVDGRHRVMGDVLVSQGTLTASLVHPREVFRAAIRRAAAALVLVHNHPSGDPAPSAEDRQVTDRLVKAGELLGIRVLDHVVVADRGYHSFSESGEL